jgi:uncharacterized membrane protein
MMFIPKSRKTNYTESTAYLINPLNAELNLICYLLALLGAHHFLHVSRVRVNMSSLILKTIEKLLDRYIKYEILSF